MDHHLNPAAAAFMQLLDTLPIIPKKLVVELSHRQFKAQYATFFGYIMRIGGILLCDNNFPDIDVQSVEPQLDLEKPPIYIYFNLIKAMYLHFRGATDQARECYYRNLENPNTEYAFDVTTIPIPESVIARHTAIILATEQDIVSRKKPFSTKFIHDHDESRNKALVARYLILCLAIDADIPLTLENRIQRTFDYLHIASSLCVSDRLQTFWKEAMYLQALTECSLNSEDQSKLYELLSNASTFSSTYVTSGKYRTIIEKSFSKLRSISLQKTYYLAVSAFEKLKITEAEKNAAKRQCEWCHRHLSSVWKLNQHRRKHAELIPRSKVAYIAAAVPNIENENEKEKEKEKEEKKK
ncbi:hypothetical protein M441DRAFT_43968 [Trichoderma asperellum CBS 433.97]|uniref:C2H2-type domain-containing protein n=1 Tax=Trichoderma asperellum (strain ATCC 204424 / CBS 433.97 / NBRC 101777) TaxID=1042311 RepID=A0A2T3ZGC4_TRIA4|nr:hypothetical protein M441DRAFT_43968 [Trichoderma asperellum CBS 433.97]PTB43833.1 hypothetical protein M441DRAFT_43968 [Trichoderma asperellum CBS 433.97]